MSRRAYRIHLKKLFTKVTETTELFNSDSSSKPDATTLTDLRDQLQRKQTILAELDKKIAASLTEEEELEQEITESEEYCSLISTNTTRITHYIDARKQLTSSRTAHAPSVTSESRDPSDTERPTPAVAAAKPQGTTRLPNLSIPMFSGDILDWQSFWDCFETAVHNISALSGVQKLNYLRAQLQGGALRVITGLPVINDSYKDSVTLLQDRYGQPH